MAALTQGSRAESTNPTREGLLTSRSGEITMHRKRSIFRKMPRKLRLHITSGNIKRTSSEEGRELFVQQTLELLPCETCLATLKGRASSLNYQSLAHAQACRMVLPQAPVVLQVIQKCVSSRTCMPACYRNLPHRQRHHMHHIGSVVDFCMFSIQGQLQ